MEQDIARFTREDMAILNDAEKWFKFYVHLPKTLTIIFGVLIFLAGLILSLLFEEFIFLTIWFGFIILPIIYMLTKVAVSYPILHIYHLKKISRIMVVKK